VDNFQQKALVVGTVDKVMPTFHRLSTAENEI